MKRIIISFVAALAIFAGTASAAPPPGSALDPTTNYLLTRILPNGTEKILANAEVTGEDAQQEQLIRAVIFEATRQQRTNNPSWRLVLYGPVDPPSTYWTNDDRIWDSLTDL